MIALNLLCRKPASRRVVRKTLGSGIQNSCPKQLGGTAQGKTGVLHGRAELGKTGHDGVCLNTNGLQVCGSRDTTHTIPKAF